MWCKTRVFFLNLFLNRVFGKSSQKMVFEKVKCLANTYKSVDLNCKLSKITNYIYKGVYFILLVSTSSSSS